MLKFAHGELWLRIIVLDVIVWMPEHSERPTAGASQSAAGAMWGLPDSARGSLS